MIENMRTFVSVLVLFAFAAVAQAELIDFDDLSHGEIVNDQYVFSHGTEFSVINIGGGPNLGVAFDTTFWNTADPDLQDPWNGGNLAPNTNLGRVLIIQEHGNDNNNDGFIDTWPDDEGSRPAGSIFIDFSSPVIEFSIDLIDNEPEEHGDFVVFMDGNTQVGMVPFSDFVTPSSSRYDPTVSYGNNYANSLPTITADSLGVESFDSIEVYFGGSGAIDNLMFTFAPTEPPDDPDPPDDPPNPSAVPEPASAAMGLLGMGLLGMRCRRRRA